MIASIAITILLFGFIDDRPNEAGRLLELIHSKSSPPKSLVFLYEGSMRWVGKPSLVESTSTFADEYQGTFLYRGDGAALYDLYHKNPSSAGGVTRKKVSVLKGRTETMREVLDRSKIGPDSVKVGRGSLTSFHPYEGPGDLFPIWNLEGLMITPNRKTTSEGWDQVDGRNCLRLRVGLASTDDPESEQQLFWLDMERGAQVVKAEFYRNSKLATRIDNIHLLEIARGSAPPYWMPISGRRRIFVLAEKVYTEPLLERTIAVVAGSTRIDVDLPDYSSPSPTARRCPHPPTQVRGCARPSRHSRSSPRSSRRRTVPASANGSTLTLPRPGASRRCSKPPPWPAMRRDGGG